MVEDNPPSFVVSFCSFCLIFCCIGHLSFHVKSNFQNSMIYPFRVVLGFVSCLSPIRVRVRQGSFWLEFCQGALKCPTLQLGHISVNWDQQERVAMGFHNVHPGRGQEHRRPLSCMWNGEGSCSGW